MHRKKMAVWWLGAEIEWFTYTPRRAKDYQQTPRSSKEFCLQVSEGTWLCHHLEFRLQNCETVHFCCDQSPRLLYFDMIALRKVIQCLIVYRVLSHKYLVCSDGKAEEQVTLNKVRVREAEAQRGSINILGTTSHRWSLYVPGHPASFCPTGDAMSLQLHHIFPGSLVWRGSHVTMRRCPFPCVKRTGTYLTGQHTHLFVHSLLQFSHSVVSNSLRPNEPQHTRSPCPSPTPRVHPNPCPLSRWCHPTISSPVIPFSSCLQSFPASGSFQMSQLFTSGGQSIGVSASTSVPPANTQDWSPLGWSGWIALQSKGLSRVFSNTAVQKHCQFFSAQLSL